MCGKTPSEQITQKTKDIDRVRADVGNWASLAWVLKLVFSVLLYRRESTTPSQMYSDAGQRSERYCVCDLG